MDTCFGWSMATISTPDYRVKSTFFFERYSVYVGFNIFKRTYVGVLPGIPDYRDTHVSTGIIKAAAR